jgi:hypothetical protein
MGHGSVVARPRSQAERTPHCGIAHPPLVPLSAAGYNAVPLPTLAPFAPLPRLRADFRDPLLAFATLAGMGALVVGES